mgnify:CR=1 FL=1
MRRAKIAKSIADYRHVRNPSVQEVACSAEPGTSAAFREHLEEIEHREYVVHTVNRRTAAPGFYVTARRETREGFQYGFAEGPFELHVEALAAVAGVRAAWEATQSRSFWYEWGTCRIYTGEIMVDDPAVIEQVSQCVA